MAPSSERRVTVTANGPGELQGLGSARPDPTDGYRANSTTTFDGRALAVIRPTGVGVITVRATAEGLGDAIVTLSAGE
ncbi:hypothetical protein [Microbacterium sp. PRC9]|uniref:hypothetical protein n=1 Tax=Microbacterium sp. PRC9 TaxID=2962591 RepID=UPI0028814C1D|nr:hypothetical protein [Microbacterium sp. PRC9]MDT0144544.1 hypothetical protein [Microbacterium sp. PRC9]